MLTGRTRYFDWVIFNSYVHLPKGTHPIGLTDIFSRTLSILENTVLGFLLKHPLSHGCPKYTYNAKADYIPLEFQKINPDRSP